MACKHGLGKFCAVCNGVVRAVIQAAPPPKPREVKIPKCNIKSDPVMFIDGTPYVSCGNCDLPVKKFDGDFRRVGARDNITKLDLERKIMIGRFVRLGETLEMDDKGFQVIKPEWKLVLQSKVGCFNCWNNQQKKILEEKHLANTVHGYRIRPVFYKKG